MVMSVKVLRRGGMVSNEAKRGEVWLSQYAKGVAQSVG
jgi:hypothetical protein